MKRKKRREKIVGSRILYEICDWSKAILTGLAVGFFVSSTLIANAQVPSGSMEETIMTGSRIIIYVTGAFQRRYYCLLLSR